MEEMCKIEQRITAVDPGSPAEESGVRPGDLLLAINGTPVADIVDYAFLTAESNLMLFLRAEDGTERTTSILKHEEEPLGLSFATSLMSPVRACRNHCLFCFIDQMPKGVRSSLSFKDDDWRLSFIMGNYVTLTNTSDAEFSRILLRRVSPLYVSVHATDGDVRAAMMRNPTAASIMERLTMLKTAGLRFHAQIVLCPEINDGTVLDQTLHDLIQLQPACASVAIVPVGLTKFRDRLYPLRCFSKAEAGRVIEQVSEYQNAEQRKSQDAFVYLSDEWYLLAGQPLPEYAHYGDFPQIENGVGLLRLFENDFLGALSGHRKKLLPRRVSVAGGRYAMPFCSRLYEKLRPYRIEAVSYAIPNKYFGDAIGVAGLVTGQDLVSALADQPLYEKLLIPHAMLREKEDLFLDGMTVADAERALHVRMEPFYDGEDFINKVFGR